MRLNLIIKKEWFLAIKSGDKTKEYRYVSERLTRQICNLDENGKFLSYKPITELMLYNGYRKDRPSMLVECVGIEKESDGDSRDEVYVFSLGKVLFCSI